MTIPPDTQNFLYSVSFLGCGLLLLLFVLFLSFCNFQSLSEHILIFKYNQFSSIQSLSHVRLFVTPWIAAHQASLSITISRSSLRLNVHRVCDAIQPSQPWWSPSSPAPNPSHHQSLFQWVNSAWGGQSTGASALASVLPKKSQGWSSEWTG